MRILINYCKSCQGSNSLVMETYSKIKKFLLDNDCYIEIIVEKDHETEEFHSFSIQNIDSGKELSYEDFNEMTNEEIFKKLRE